MNGRSAPHRKDMILDHAQQLFIERGFVATTVKDILERTGIAKGTLYHHFKSKDDIVHQLIARTTTEMRNKAEQVAADKKLSPVDKFVGVIAAAQVQGPSAKLIEHFHRHENTDFHVLSITQAVLALAPVLAQTVHEGIEKGVFTTPNPEADCRVLLLAGFMLPDQGIFPQLDTQQQLTNVIGASERLLGCTPGTIASAFSNTKREN